MSVKVGEKFEGNATGYWLGTPGGGEETMTLRGYVGKSGSRWCAIAPDGLVLSKHRDKWGATSALRSEVTP